MKLQVYRQCPSTISVYDARVLGQHTNRSSLCRDLFRAARSLPLEQRVLSWLPVLQILSKRGNANPFQEFSYGIEALPQTYLFPLTRQCPLLYPDLNHDCESVRAAPDGDIANGRCVQELAEYFKTNASCKTSIVAAKCEGRFMASHLAARYFHPSLPRLQASTT